MLLQRHVPAFFLVFLYIKCIHAGLHLWLVTFCLHACLTAATGLASNTDPEVRVQPQSLQPVAAAQQRQMMRTAQGTSPAPSARAWIRRLKRQGRRQQARLHTLCWGTLIAHRVDLFVGFLDEMMLTLLCECPRCSRQGPTATVYNMAWCMEQWR